MTFFNAPSVTGSDSCGNTDLADFFVAASLLSVPGAENRSAGYGDHKCGTKPGSRFLLWLWKDFFLIPYGITPRVMCPVLKTLPNWLAGTAGTDDIYASAYEHTGCCGWSCGLSFVVCCALVFYNENGFKGRWKNNETSKSRVL